MKPQLLIPVLIVFFLYSCEPQKPSTAHFEEDLVALKEYFHIPGLAAMVMQDGEIIYENYFGYADPGEKKPVDATTRFPIASVTKVFASILLMQLAEEGQVDLEEPINNYIENSSLPDAVKIKHVLSHTSEGKPGNFFNYSSRFSMLTTVIEKASGKTFTKLLHEKILIPQQLNATIPLDNKHTLDSIRDQLAMPYFYFGTVESGHFDTGLNASSGLVSTVSDLARFNRALESGKLISDASKTAMFSPFYSDDGRALPYGYGIFTQEFLEKKLVWGYGQEDCFSSLLLKVPEEKITLLLLANTNLMSDPARLIQGDVTYSLFALNFLKHFVFELPEKRSFSDFSKPEALEMEGIKKHPETAAFYRQELLAHALAAGFMGYADSTVLQQSKALTQLAVDNFPEYKSYGNNSTMRLLTVLSTDGNFRVFDPVIEELGTTLLEVCPYDPYANVSLGYHYANLNQEETAARHFRAIAEAENFRPFWYTIEALDFLGDYYKKNDPEQAKAYFQKIIDIGWNIDGKLDKAKAEMEQLNAVIPN